MEAPSRGHPGLLPRKEQPALFLHQSLLNGEPSYCTICPRQTFKNIILRMKSLIKVKFTYSQSKYKLTGIIHSDLFSPWMKTLRYLKLVHRQTLQHFPGSPCAWMSVSRLQLFDWILWSLLCYWEIMYSAFLKMAGRFKSPSHPDMHPGGRCPASKWCKALSVLAMSDECWWQGEGIRKPRASKKGCNHPHSVIRQISFSINAVSFPFLEFV